MLQILPETQNNYIDISFKDLSNKFLSLPLSLTSHALPSIHSWLKNSPRVTTFYPIDRQSLLSSARCSFSCVSCINLFHFCFSSIYFLLSIFFLYVWARKIPLSHDFTLLHSISFFLMLGRLPLQVSNLTRERERKWMCDPRYIQNDKTVAIKKGWKWRERERDLGVGSIWNGKWA